MINVWFEKVLLVYIKIIMWIEERSGMVETYETKQVEDNMMGVWLWANGYWQDN